MFSGTEQSTVLSSRLRQLRATTAVAIALVGVVSGCQCDVGPFRNAAPKLVADPNPIVFADAVVGRTSEIEVKISNKGFSPLKFSAAPEVVMDTPTSEPVYGLADVFLKSCAGDDRKGDATTINSGDCATLKLRYRPIDISNNAAKLRFVSNDPRHTVDVPIQATAVTNTITVCLEDNGTETCNQPGQPLTVAFADLIAVGDHGSKQLKLKSLGTKAVEVDSMTVSGDVDFSTDPAANTFAQMNLEPTAEWPFQVKVTPIAGGLRSAKILFTTSDPANTNLEVDVSVTGDGPGLCWCIGSTTQRCVPTTVADFGDVTAGTEGTMYLEMSSCGTKPLVFVKETSPTDPPVSITAGTPTFSATGLPAANLSLAPGASPVHVDLKFVPPTLMSYQGTLEINTNIQRGTIALKGNGVMGGCSLSAPSVLDMGSVQRGGSGSKQFAVSNRGTEPCTFPSAPVVTMGADVKFSLTSFPLNAIAPGGTAQFTVAYEPQDLTGPDTGVLTISYLGQSEPATTTPHELPVQLKGTPVAQAQCKLKATPAGTAFGGKLNFGQVQVNTEARLPVTFTNVGSSNCVLKKAKIVPFMGTSSAFRLPTPVNNVTVNPGSAVTIDVAFKPTSDIEYGSPIGSVGGDMLTVDTSDTATFNGQSCTTLTFPPTIGAAGCNGWGLAGTGVRSPLQVLPPNIDFGEVTLGCNSSDRTVTLYNIGTATIHITELKIDPAPPPTIFSVSSPPVSFPISPGGHVDITVRYTPPDAMPHSASLFIKSDATASSGNPYVTVSLRGSGTTNSHQTDTFQQAAQPKTDVLFVVDNSGSMAEEQGHLADNATRFAGIADQLHSDYHISVVTTDVEDPAQSGKFQGSPKIISPSTQAANQFATRVRALGTNGSGTERGLEAMYLALSDPLINDPMNNAGFLRDDAKLAVVVVSDEDDQSTAAVDFYYNFLLNIKGPYNASLVTFNAIVGDKPQGCTSGDGDAVSGDRYIDLQGRTGGKFRSICVSDWGAIASDLGLDIFAARAGFTLTRVPDVATIVVHVNGSLVSNSAWTFNARANAVVFNPNALPAAGSTIVIDYDAHCF